MGMEWKARVCLCVHKRWATVSGVTYGQIISNELCKSPQSNTGRQWVMLTTPSQWDYMNIFIGQQKAKESRRRAFSISVKSVHLYWWHAKLIFGFSSLDFSIEMLCTIELAALADIVEVGAGCVEGWLKPGQAGNPFVLHHNSICLFFLSTFFQFSSIMSLWYGCRVGLKQRTAGLILPSVHCISLEQDTSKMYKKPQRVTRGSVQHGQYLNFNGDH